MTEKKIKLATKKVTTLRAGSAVASKPKNTKAEATTTAKKAVVKMPVAKSLAAKNPAVKKTAANSTAAVVAESKKTKAPAVKKETIPTVEKKAPAMKATVAMAKPATTQKMVAKPTPEESYRRVETTAYFIAEQHGFNGCSDEHWAAAEREIASKLD
jgi:Protein of unknown function (DUF2934)